MCWKKCVEKFQISWVKTRWQCFISTLVGGHKYPYDHILILVQHGEPEDEQEGEDEVVDVGVWHLSLSLTGDGEPDKRWSNISRAPTLKELRKPVPELHPFSSSSSDTFVFDVLLKPRCTLCNNQIRVPALLQFSWIWIVSGRNLTGPCNRHFFQNLHKRGIPRKVQHLPIFFSSHCFPVFLDHKQFSSSVSFN